MRARLLPFLLLSIVMISFQPGCKKNGSAPRPKADFSFSYASQGLLPSVVNFTSTSTNATAVSWRFGDGDTASGATATHSYVQTGNYNVTLVATGSGGVDSISKVVSITLQKPKADFHFNIVNAGNYPSYVSFTNQSTGSGILSRWDFDNKDTSHLANPIDSFFQVRAFNVKLVVSNAAGADSVTKAVTISINPPTPAFTFAILNAGHLPLNISAQNRSIKAASYIWDFGDGGISQEVSPTHSYSANGIFTIKLTAINPGGSATTSQQIYVSPYPVTYTDFDGATLSLYAWEGKKVAILSTTPNLNATTMLAWATTMDSVYNFYKRCTGREPGIAKIVNNHTTIADVPSTCGAGCGYLGATGIEMLDSYFNVMYNGIKDNNQYDQEDFYEFGRNFWFYGDQLAYKANDPIATGYAVLMRFLSLDATGVQGGPFNGTMPYAQFKSAVETLVDQYVANTSLNWSNTLAVNTGVPGGFGGATDLFASFCMRLMRDYGGDNFIDNVWKLAGQRPAAATTQDAVDNFVLAACGAANKNLTNLFMTQWRWPVSATAQAAAAQYP